MVGNGSCHYFCVTTVAKGGAVYIASRGFFFVQRTTFEGCTGYIGGAVHITSGALLLEGNPSCSDWLEHESQERITRVANVLRVNPISSERCERRRWPSYDSTAGNSFLDNSAFSGCVGPHIYCDNCGGCPPTTNTLGSEIQCELACSEFFTLTCFPVYCAVLGITLLLIRTQRSEPDVRAAGRGSRVAVEQSTARRNTHNIEALTDDAQQGVEGLASTGTLIYVALLAVSRTAVLLEVPVDWGVLTRLFGWLKFFALPMIPLPHASTRTKLGLAILPGAFAQASILLRLGALFVTPRDGMAPRSPPIGGDERDWRLLPKTFADACFWLHQRTRSVCASWTICVVLFLCIGLAVPGCALYAGVGFVMCGPLIWAAVVGLSRRRWWRVVATNFGEGERETAYWTNVVDNEVQVLSFGYLSTYSVAVNALVTRLIAGDGSFGTYLWLLLAFAPLPPWIVWVVARSAKHTQSSGDDSPLRAAHTLLVKPFEDRYWWFKAWMMVEMTVFTVVTLAAPSKFASLVAGLAVCTASLVVSLVYRPFVEDVEDYSDIISKLGTTVIAACGLALEKRASNALVQTIMILCVCAVSLWFIRVFNPMRVASALKAELTRAGRAAEVQEWSREVIAALSADRIRRLSLNDVCALSEHQQRWLVQDHRDTLVDSGVDMCALGFRASTLTAAELTMAEYAQVGFVLRVEDLKDLGFTVADAKRAGFISSASQAYRQAKFGAADLRMARCFSPAAVHAVVHSVAAESLGDADADSAAQDIRNDVGHCASTRWPDGGDWPSPTELALGGYSAAEAREVGYGADELKHAGGLSIAELVAANYPIAELRAAGCTMTELRSAGVASADFLAAFDGTVNQVKSLKAAGFTASELIEQKVIESSATVVWELGYSASDACKAGISAGEIWRIAALQEPHRSGDEFMLGQQVITRTKSWGAKPVFATGTIAEAHAGSSVRVENDGGSTTSMDIAHVRPMEWCERGEWKAGLFSCDENPKTCCLGALCGPRLICQLSARIAPPNPCARLLAACFWIPNVVMNLVCLGWIAKLILFGWIDVLQLARIRRRIRARDGILPMCGYEDCVVACCCPDCLKCQLARQEGFSSADYRLHSKTGFDETPVEVPAQTQPTREEEPAGLIIVTPRPSSLSHGNYQIIEV